MEIKTGNSGSRQRESRGKSSSHPADLERKQSFCHESRSLEKIQSGGRRDFFSAGVIKKADSPSHFHLPPSARALLTRESFFPLPS